MNAGGKNCPLPLHLPELICFPNPFNNSATLKIYADTEEYGVLKIYNTKGELVNIFTLEKLNIGWNELTIANLSPSSGVYFLRAEIGKTYSLGKVVLLK